MAQDQPGGTPRWLPPRWLLNGAAVLILGVWAVAVMADVFSSTFEAPIPLYGLATLVAGALYGVSLVKRP